MTIVDVYRNLHKKCYSIRDKSTKLVIAHVHAVLLKEVTFKVSEAGRQRVLKEKRKNVHATVCGNLCFERHPTIDHTWTKVSYNPYLCGYFVDSFGNEISTANICILTNQGCFIK